MAEVSRAEEQMVANTPNLSGIVDQIADGLPKPKGDDAPPPEAKPAAEAKPEPKTEAKPAEKPRNEKGQFEADAAAKRERNLSEQRKIIEAAVNAKKALEAEKSDLQRELESLKARLHGKESVPEPKVDLNAVLDNLVKSGEMTEADAKHYRGAGRKVIEALVQANSKPMDTIDPGTLEEFKKFSEQQKYLRAVGSAFDAWRAEQLAAGNERVADREYAENVLREWQGSGAAATPQAFSLVDRALKSEYASGGQSAEVDAKREAARQAAGGIDPADMGTGAPVDTLQVRRQKIRAAGKSGDLDDLAGIAFDLLGGDKAFFPKEQE